MELYHTGKTEIREPDIFYGRKNADFGQGFYLSPDKDFIYRWAVKDAVINRYDLNVEGLDIHYFERDEEWFDYIFNNRRVKDKLEVDVVIGPIANDTIFDTMGIISSGFLEPKEALQLLSIGPKYTQVAIKTEKAAEQLEWISSEYIHRIEESVKKKEEEAYIKELSEKISCL